MKIKQVIIAFLMIMFLYNCEDSKKVKKQYLSNGNDESKTEIAQQPVAQDSADYDQPKTEKMVNEYAWETSYSTALKKAKESGKNLLLDFTGSDWCGWCIKLDDEVFSKIEFKVYAKENLILVKLDFPKSIEQSKKLKEQNNALAKKFGIKGFPTIIIIDSNEELIGQTGYQQGGPVNYVKHLKGIIGSK